MPHSFATPSVKRRLERSAERDKREIKNNLSAVYAQSKRGAHSKSSTFKKGRCTKYRAAAFLRPVGAPIKKEANCDKSVKDKNL